MEQGRLHEGRRDLEGLRKVQLDLPQGLLFGGSVELGVYWSLFGIRIFSQEVARNHASLLSFSANSQKERPNATLSPKRIIWNCGKHELFSCLAVSLGKREAHSNHYETHFTWLWI